MKERLNSNDNGALRTYRQIASETNLGVSTVTKIAKESGALVKIGAAARVDPEIFYRYLDEHYRVKK